MVMSVGLYFVARGSTRVADLSGDANLGEGLQNPVDGSAGDFRNARPDIGKDLVCCWMILAHAQGFENQPPLHGNWQGVAPANLLEISGLYAGAGALAHRCNFIASVKSCQRVNRCSPRNPIGIGVSPLVARSARTSPTEGANLKPWPENPAASHTFSCSGCRSMIKCSSGVIV